MTPTPEQNNYVESKELTDFRSNLEDLKVTIEDQQNKENIRKANQDKFLKLLSLPEENRYNHATTHFPEQTKEIYEGLL
jgi:hypothetical protein